MKHALVRNKAVSCTGSMYVVRTSQQVPTNMQSYVILIIRFFVLLLILLIRLLLLIVLLLLLLIIIIVLLLLLLLLDREWIVHMDKDE